MAWKPPHLLIALAWRTALAVAAAFVLASLYAKGLPDKYSARALLLLSPLPFEYAEDVPSAVSTQDIDSRRVSFVKVRNIAPLSMPDYRLLFTSEDTATRLAEKVKSIYEKLGLNAASVSPASLMGALDLRHKTLLTTNADVRYQQVVELVVTSGNPELAAGIANAWAELCVDVAKQVRQTTGEGAVGVLQAQINQVQAKLTDVSKKRFELDSQADIDNRVQLEALDREQSLQESLLKELKTSLNAAEIVTRDATPEFKVVSHALVPAGPNGPDRRLYVLVAVFLAAVGAPVLYFTLAALTRYARIYEEQATKP